MITKKLVIPSLLLLLFGMSCSKDKNISTEDRQAAQQASEEYLMAEQIYDNVFREVDTQAKQQGQLNGFTTSEDELDTRGNCPQVKLDLTANTIFPATLTLDYQGDCNGNGKPAMAGKITAVFNGLLLKGGTSIQLSFSDFSYAGHAVSGTYEIVNQGKDASGQPTLTSVVDGQITTPAGKTFSYQATTTSKQTEGNDTNFFNAGLAGILDDVWSTTRDAVLNSSSGLQVDISTPSAIQSPFSCKWPVSGFFALDINQPSVTGSIDFGDGNCDDKAVLTLGDYTVELDL